MASVAAVALLLAAAGLAIVAIGSRADEPLQLSTAAQPSTSADASAPASVTSATAPTPPTPPPAPAAPTEEDPETLEGTPGVVTGGPAATGPDPVTPSNPVEIEDVEWVPVPNPSPPTAPIEPIDLLQVGSTSPTVPGGGGEDSGGSFAPNVSGCALSCVTKAVLTPNVTTPNLGFDLEATVPARIDIALTNTNTGQQSLFTSSGFKTLWTTTLAPLDPGTEYDLVLEATDEDGQRRVHTTTLTTRASLDNPGGLQTNQPGCAGGCITQATVTPTERPDEVRFDVETDTPASVRIWMSASEPQWTDGIPTLPADTLVEPTLGIKQAFSVEKAFLEPNSWYHVVVRAEDEHGADYQVGTFHTADRPPSEFDVRINFELIFVQWDGDPAWLDEGELSFAMGYLDGDQDLASWYRSEEKLEGGRTVHLGDETEHYTILGPNDLLPSPGVTAQERDTVLDFEVVPELVEVPTNEDRLRRNPAWGPPLTLNGIQNLQTCGEMGVDSAEPDAYCVSFQTVDQADEQFPNVQVIVSYELSPR